MLVAAKEVVYVIYLVLQVVISSSFFLLFCVFCDGIQKVPVAICACMCVLIFCN